MALLPKDSDSGRKRQLVGATAALSPLIVVCLLIVAVFAVDALFFNQLDPSNANDRWRFFGGVVFWTYLVACGPLLIAIPDSTAVHPVLVAVPVALWVVYVVMAARWSRTVHWRVFMLISAFWVAAGAIRFASMLIAAAVRG